MDQNTPVTTFRNGRLKATVWENQNDKGETYFSTTLAKTYEDRNGQLKDSHSFGKGELPRVEKLAAKSFDFILDLEHDRSLERKSTPQRDQRED
ncbi:MAG: hypothetical protein AAF376_03825 [Pseudomonadota bacterium]